VATPADPSPIAPLREGAESLLAPLLFDPVRGAWIKGYARAVRDAEGRLIGVVQARIDAKDFRRVMARLGLGEGGQAGLFLASDGAPLTLYPLAPAGPAAIQPPPLPPLPLNQDPAGREGRFEGVAPDGQALLVAWRMIGGELPVLAVASLSRTVALAPCRERLARNATLFGLAAALLALLAVVLAVPVLATWMQTGLVPRLPTAVLSASLVLLAFLSLACGLILDTVTRGRQEAKRIAYLAQPAPADWPADAKGS
jgi:hypothetical protein